MKFRFLITVFFLGTYLICQAGDDKLFTKMADEICTCLNASSDSLVERSQDNNCIINKLHPFKKAIMKIVRKSMKDAMNEDSFSDQEIENFNKKLDAALYKTCPNKAKAFIDITDLLADE